jgi:hypothetical protein
MSGLDRAGFMATARQGESQLITSTMSSTTCPWETGYSGFQVISSQAVIAKVTDAGVKNSSLITSGSSFSNNAWLGMAGATYVRISTKTTGHKILGYKKVLL